LQKRVWRRDSANGEIGEVFRAKTKSLGENRQGKKDPRGFRECGDSMPTAVTGGKKNQNLRGKTHPWVGGE